MESVGIMNLLRQRALPGTDIAKPAQVLAKLNRMFPMDDHAGMYFTMWYGIYDTISRTLTYATAGHHPGFLVSADRRRATPPPTPCGLVRADPQTAATSATVQRPY